MRNDILLAVIIFVIVVILLYNSFNVKATTSNVDRSSAAVVVNDSIDYEISQPTHLPIYKMKSEDGQKPTPTANYTDVPHNIGEYLKPFEPHGMEIIDTKLETEQYIMTGNPEEKSIMEQEHLKEIYKDMLDIGNENENNLQIDLVKNLDVNKDCKDAMPEQCEQWKLNNDCLINPDFMLKNCPNACGSCKFSNSQNFMLTKIYNSRDSYGCASHGGY